MIDRPDPSAFNRLLLTSFRRTLELTRGRPPAERVPRRLQALRTVAASFQTCRAVDFVPFVLATWDILVEDVAAEATALAGRDQACS